MIIPSIERGRLDPPDDLEFCPMCGQRECDCVWCWRHREWERPGECWYQPEGDTCDETT